MSYSKVCWQLKYIILSIYFLLYHIVFMKKRPYSGLKRIIFKDFEDKT